MFRFTHLNVAEIQVLPRASPNNLEMMFTSGLETDLISHFMIFVRRTKLTTYSTMKCAFPQSSSQRPVPELPETGSSFFRLSTKHKSRTASPDPRHFVACRDTGGTNRRRPG
jgi:hypothetical protein